MCLLHVCHYILYCFRLDYKYIKYNLYNYVNTIYIKLVIINHNLYNYIKLYTTLGSKL